MRPHRLLLAIGLAGVCLLLSSCIDTKTPLSDPEKAKADPQLAGVWRGPPTMASVEYYHVGLAGGNLPPGIMRIVSVTHNKDGSLGRPVELLAVLHDHRREPLPERCGDRREEPRPVREEGLASRTRGRVLAAEIPRGGGFPVGLGDGSGRETPAHRGRQDQRDRRQELGVLHRHDGEAGRAAGLPEGADLFKKEPVRYQRVK